MSDQRRYLSEYFVSFVAGAIGGGLLVFFLTDTPPTGRYTLARADHVDNMIWVLDTATGKPLAYTQDKKTLRIYKTKWDEEWVIYGFAVDSEGKKENLWVPAEKR